MNYVDLSSAKDIGKLLCGMVAIVLIIPTYEVVVLYRICQIIQSDHGSLLFVRIIRRFSTVRRG